MITALTVQLVSGQNPQWIVYDTSNTIMLSPFITDIDIDSNNNKWIGSKLGISKFDNTNWTNFNTPNSGLFNQLIYSLASEGNKIWIGGFSNYNSSGSGLVSFDGNIWNVYDSLNTPMLSNIVTSVSIDNQNNKWIGGPTGQVLKFDNSYWTVFNNIYDPQWGYLISDIEFDADTVWLATCGMGIWKFTNASDWIFLHTGNSGLPNASVFTIKNKNSIKWIGTWDGLAKLEGSTWTIYDTENSDLPSNGVFSIAIENNGTIWIGTNNGGIVKFDGNIMTIYNTSNSNLPNNTIRTIKIDGNNNKWIGTDKGVAVFNENGVILSSNEIRNDKSLIRIFPNPFNKETFIEFKNIDNERYYLNVFNVTGQMVEKIDNITGNMIKVERKNLNSGIYFFQLKSAKGIVAQGKLIIE